MAWILFTSRRLIEPDGCGTSPDGSERRVEDVNTFSSIVCVNMVSLHVGTHVKPKSGGTNALQETGRDRETDPKHWVSALDQETYILSSPDAHTDTNPTHPPAQHRARQPCGRVR